MGTSEFSVPVMLALVQGGYEIKMVYTRPDSPGGRGQKMILSPVKRAAIDNSWLVRQPENFRDREEVDYLGNMNPAAIIVAAYGLILPGEVLRLPSFGCINVHPSLLPYHRGPSPVPSSILAGDKETGVSIMLMDEGIDTGPVLKQQSLPIGEEDTTETLTCKLAEMGGTLLLQVLPDWFEGKIKAVPQSHPSHAEAIYSKIIRKEEGEINWQSQRARDIWLRVRAYYPWPGCYTRWKGKLLKILRARVLDFQEEPGKVVEKSLAEEAGKKVIGAGAREGLLGLELVQYEGGRAMPALEFARGHRDFVGSWLGVRDQATGSGHWTFDS